MTHDDERDYAEERANLADMRREAEAEAAHEALVGRITQALRELAFDAYDGGRAALDRLHEEIVHRQAPNAHRYELLARQQHTALLAAMTATAVEEFAGYDLLDAAQGVTEAYVTTHRPPRPTICSGGHCRPPSPASSAPYSPSSTPTSRNRSTPASRPTSTRPRRTCVG
jgi:hypothetical protein